jgi:hypothetical protein
MRGDQVSGFFWVFIVSHMNISIPAKPMRFNPKHPGGLPEAAVAPLRLGKKASDLRQYLIKLRTNVLSKKPPDVTHRT